MGSRRFRGVPSGPSSKPVSQKGGRLGFLPVPGWGGKGRGGEKEEGSYLFLSTLRTIRLKATWISCTSRMVRTMVTFITERS